MDATCAPSDIRYPTDLNLVNDARELSETIIDQLRKQLADPNPRPRTKPNVCRKRYLEIIKHPKCGTAKRRKALRFLLNAVRRNLSFIRQYQYRTEAIPDSLQTQVGIIQTLHDQQREMLTTRSGRVDNRIVGLQRPHVRPIVRGKAGRETEFGAKLTASMGNGFRENLRYCAEHGIRLSGPKLGRPSKVIDLEALKQQLADSSNRNAIEGKFGQCKRRFGPGRVMARRKDCSETVIAVTIPVANLIRWNPRAARSFAHLFPVIISHRPQPEKQHKFQTAA